MARISNKFAIYITGGRFISMLAGFLMPVVLVRVMPKGNYGLTSQFLTLYTSIYTIAAMGLHTNLFFFCNTDDQRKMNKYVTNTLFLLLLFGVITGFLLFLSPVKQLLFGDSELGKHSDLIILCIALATIMNVVSPLNTIRQDKWGALLYPGFVTFGRLGAILYSAMMFRDIHHLFFCLFIFQCLISAAILLYVRFKTKLELDFSLMKEQLVYSLPFGLAVALQLVSNYFDKLVCIRMLTPAEYAIYGIAFLSIPGINQIYDSLCQVNIVNMSNSFRSGRIVEIQPLYGSFVIKTLSFSVPVILVVALFSEEIMTFLYTSSYVSAAMYFRLYSLTFLTSMLGAGTVLRSLGKTKLSMYAYFITCVVGMPITFFLIKYYGTTGAIIGAMINIILPRFIQMYFEANSLKLSLGDFLPWKVILSIMTYSLMFLIPLVVLKISFDQSIWICIFESSLYIIIVYLIFVKKDIFTIKKNVIFCFFETIKLRLHL